MKIEQFNTLTLRQLRTVMQRALNLADVEGVSFEVGNIKFSANECTIKITATTDGQVAVDEGQLKRMMQTCGIAKVEADGWKLIKFDDKKRKYPFIALNPRGNQYKLTSDQARGRFGTIPE